MPDPIPGAPGICSPLALMPAGSGDYEHWQSTVSTKLFMWSRCFCGNGSLNTIIALGGCGRSRNTGRCGGTGSPGGEIAVDWFAWRHRLHLIAALALNSVGRETSLAVLVGERGGLPPSLPDPAVLYSRIQMRTAFCAGH